jgi:Tol biopolymer transport system component
MKPYKITILLFFINLIVIPFFPGSFNISSSAISSESESVPESKVSVMQEPGADNGSQHRILFETNRDGDWELYLMNIDGGHLQNLTQSVGDDEFATISKTGKIAFISNRYGTPDIYIMNPDGSGLKRITSTAEEKQELDWSPNEDYIVFTAGNLDNERVCLVSVEGDSDYKVISRYDKKCSYPRWSPDGDEILYVRQDGSFLQLYYTDPFGDRGGKYTSKLIQHWMPAWSPAGDELVYMGGNSNKWSLYSLNVKTGQGENLTGRYKPAVNPVWSPDGQNLVFMSRRFGSFDIFVVSRNGNKVRRITRNSGRESTPYWSPDGKWITYWSDEDGDPEVWVTDAEGLEHKKLTNNSQRDINAQWIK